MRRIRNSKPDDLVSSGYPEIYETLVFKKENKNKSCKRFCFGKYSRMPSALIGHRLDRPVCIFLSSGGKLIYSLRAVGLNLCRHLAIVVIIFI